jgi:hypothetical protein
VAIAEAELFILCITGVMSMSDPCSAYWSLAYRCPIPSRGPLLSRPWEAKAADRHECGSVALYLLVPAGYFLYGFDGALWSIALYSCGALPLALFFQVAMAYSISKRNS